MMLMIIINIMIIITVKNDGKNDAGDNNKYNDNNKSQKLKMRIIRMTKAKLS